MTGPDLARLRALEAEAKRFEQEDDYLSALDVYEEIDRRGWASADHLLALGHCYLRNRQRQNARTAWLRALEAQPDHRGVREALDRFFPGWESQPSAPRRPASAAPQTPRPSTSDTGAGRSVASPTAPPPPPPFVPPTEATMRVETTTTERPRRAQPPVAEPRASEPPQPIRRETHSDTTLQTVRRSEPAARVERSENRVNWEYVFADAAEGLIGTN